MTSSAAIKAKRICCMMDAKKMTQKGSRSFIVVEF
jgi:hypothetical protein